MLKIAWSEVYVLSLPKNHRFPMEKYALLPQQLKYEGTAESNNFFSPQPLEEKYILNTHQEEYWYKLKNLTLSKQEIRRSGFPLSKELINREITIAQGSIQCALYAMEYGVSLNIAGGTHHAFTNQASGFCLLNDFAIAANYLLDNNLIQKALVVDLDVHQGDGTAEIFTNNPTVFTLSFHGAKNFPLHKEQSDLDVALPDGTNDDDYLKKLKAILPTLIQDFQPDIIFYQAGVDVLETDKLGRLAMTRDGCKKRDTFVLEQAYQYKIPISISMGGGYSERISDIVEAHANTFRLAREIFF